MGLVVKHCVTCGSENLVMIGGCVWECEECGEMFTVDIEVATLLGKISKVCDQMLARWNDGR